MSMNNEDKIKEFLKNNYGYITTSEFLNLGINKPSIQTFIDKGIIERVSHGLYMDTSMLLKQYH